MFKIEKNVGFPGNRIYEKYPFSKMDVGDSFLVPPNQARQAQSASSQYSRYHLGAVKFKTRTQADGSVRIWRVE